jgi:uncharacterized protein with FMN-binding domain
MRRSIPLLMTTFTALAPTGAALASPARARAAATHTYRGQGGVMRWGTVQVTITISGRRLTAVTATYPADRARSRVINSQAVPTLRNEALRAQSYRIHSLSGATLTSHAFVGSLYSAMHAAHLA